MICKECGAVAREIRPNYYRCDYCASEFFGDAPNSAPAPTASSPAPRANIGNILSGEDIYDRSVNSVVEVLASTPDTDDCACSSGFVVSEEGLILTNAHAVLDECGQIYKTIIVKSGETAVPAYVVALGKPEDGVHNCVDLCLLYAPNLHERAESFGDSSTVRNGQRVYLMGNSLGMGTCITEGIVSDKARAMPALKFPYIMTDVAANHGNSGGPLYNERGEVIGVLVAGIDNAEGMNFAIPSNVADSFIAHVVKNTNLGDAHISELEKYTSPMSHYSATVSLVFEGVRIAIDVIEYIINLFRKKKQN